MFNGAWCPGVIMEAKASGFVVMFDGDTEPILMFRRSGSQIAAPQRAGAGTRVNSVPSDVFGVGTRIESNAFGHPTDWSSGIITEANANGLSVKFDGEDKPVQMFEFLVSPLAAGEAEERAPESSMGDDMLTTMQRSYHKFVHPGNNGNEGTDFYITLGQRAVYVRRLWKSLPGLLDDHDKLATEFLFWATGNVAFFENIFRPLYERESDLSLRKWGRAVLCDVDLERWEETSWQRNYLQKNRIGHVSGLICDYVATVEADDALANAVFWSSRRSSRLPQLTMDAGTDGLHPYLRCLLEFVKLAHKAHAMITNFVEASRGMKLLGVPGNLSGESLKVSEGAALCGNLLGMFQDEERGILDKGFPVRNMKMLIIPIHLAFPKLQLLTAESAADATPPEWIHF